MPHYTVVARSRASAVFYPGNALQTVCTLPDGRVVELVFRTNYIEGFSVPAPTSFYVEANGKAASLDEASLSFHQAALEVATMIAFVVNADLGLLEVELAFDSSPDSNEHPFVQTFIPNPAPIHIPGRPIDPDLVRDFLSACDHHAERERIQRSIAQYGEALKRWNSGHGLICLAHLYIGAETLTKTILRQHLKTVRINEDGLANDWKIEKKQLDNEIRRRFIFAGDGDTLKLARAVSDGFEHGYSKLSEMQAPAAEIVVKVAQYLRTAIVHSVCGDSQLANALLGDPWWEPRGPMNLIKKLRGTLIGPSDKLASKDTPYPILNWRSGLKSVTIEANGRYSFDPSETITPQLGGDIQLRLGAFEVWDNQLVDQIVASEANRGVQPSPVIVISNPPPKSSLRARLMKKFGNKP